MQYCISDGILKHNHTKTFPLAGKSVGNGIHNSCNRQIFPCEYNYPVYEIMQEALYKLSNCGFALSVPCCKTFAICCNNFIPSSLSTEKKHHTTVEGCER